MNRRDEDAKGMRADETGTLEPELREALGNFKSSVDAWSDAIMSRPREVKVSEKVSERINWAFFTKWALGCAVFAGTVSGAVYQNHRQQQAVKIEAARVAEQQQELAAQKAKEQSAEDLMAKVDSDIDRQVPRALEPLASLMNEDESTGN